MTAGAICGVETEVVRVERQEPRWCFGCRKRLGGTLTMRRPSFETLMATGAWGWADPVYTYRCDGCADDRRLGFGMEWEWTE